MKWFIKTIRHIPTKAVYAIIALTSLVFMFYHSEISGFWYDEFAQICYSGSGQSLLDSLLVADPTPPLFTVAANIWYNIAPYGERWLLLLPQLAVAGAVYVCGLWGECLGGKVVGLWSALLLGSSQMVIEQCGFEFRSYGFYLLFSTLALHVCTRRLLHDEESTGRKNLLFGAVLAGLQYSHLFGSLLFAALFLAETADTVRRKDSLQRFLPYLYSAVFFVPWMIYYFGFAARGIGTATAAWMTVPNVWDVVKLGAYLCNNNIVQCGVLVVGGIGVLRLALRKERGEPLANARFLPIAATVFAVICAYLFAMVHSEFSSLWVKRYFTGLFSCSAVICALGVGRCAEWLRQKSRVRLAGAAVYAVVAMGVVFVSLYKAGTGESHLPRYYHREIVGYLTGQAEVKDERALVLSTMSDYIGGLEEYYIAPLGERSYFSIQSVFDVSTETVEQYDVVYLDYNFWEDQGRAAESVLFLAENYTLDQSWDDICLD